MKKNLLKFFCVALMFSMAFVACKDEDKDEYIINNYIVVPQDSSVVSIDSIYLNKTKLEMYVGEKDSLLLSVVPDSIKANTIWTSSNEKIVKVNSNGGVLAVDNGSATITVISDNLKVAKCNVIVKNRHTSEGLLQGVFSVSPTKKIQFSQGNLQYLASENIWRFAEEQYAICAEDNVGATSIHKSWIDLFAWATSGYHNSLDYYNIYYNPWERGDKDNAYSEMNYSGFGPSLNMEDLNLTLSSANYDWGVYNAITNGGNKKGVWRTMTAEEWNYLLNVRENSKQKIGLAVIHNRHGLLLLPDEVNIGGLSFVPLADEITINKYTDEEWKNLEKKGVVFLPNAGTLDGTYNYNSLDVPQLNPGNYLQHYANYWTSSVALGNSGVKHFVDNVSTNNSYVLLANAIGVTISTPKMNNITYCEMTVSLSSRYSCKSVRLIQELD